MLCLPYFLTAVLGIFAHLRVAAGCGFVIFFVACANPDPNKKAAKTLCKNIAASGRLVPHTPKLAPPLLHSQAARRERAISYQIVLPVARLVLFKKPSMFS